MFHTAHFDDIGAGPRNLRAHGVEEVGQVHNVRLAGTVLNDCQAIGQYGCDHDIHGGAHGDDVEIDMTAVQPFRSIRFHKSRNLLHLGTHGLKALDVLVKGAGRQSSSRQGMATLAWPKRPSCAPIR